MGGRGKRAGGNHVSVVLKMSAFAPPFSRVVALKARSQTSGISMPKN